MNPVEIVRGTGPVILGLPHTGTFVPPDIWQKLNARGQELSDTDWHIEKLYDGLLPGVTTVRATFHRYVIDANRDPSGESLYPGQNTTGLVPFTDFDGDSIWQVQPKPDEIEQRRQTFHTPYHAALTAEMERVHAAHGIAILYDCHSIRSRIPFLFEGVLPDFNIGTSNGQTCDVAIEQAVKAKCASESAYATVLNGRFKGGWTTRHYGQPKRNWHAIQMELAQSAYLTNEAAPWLLDEGKVRKLRPILADVLQALHDFARKHAS